MTGPFRPDELSGTPEGPSAAELATAFGAARDLEAALPDEPLALSAGFADRVMTAVAAEPTPSVAGFLGPLRHRRGLAGVGASVAAAWAVLTGGAARPAAARGIALVYVLAAALLTTTIVGLGAYGTAGALGLLDGSPAPSATAPAPSPTVPAPSESPLTPTPAPSASPTATPTVSPAPPTASPPASVEPSDEPSEEPSESPEGGDDNSGSGSSGSPHPSETLEPSETPD